MEAVKVGEQEMAGAADEEAADFERVAAMVGDGAAPGAPVAEAEPEAPRMDAVESLAGFLSMLGHGASIAGFSRTAAVWSPDACGNVASATVPVLRKYPWGARILDFLEAGTGAEEVALVMVCAPLVVATVGAVKADMAGDGSAPVDAPAEQVGVMREVHGHAD